MSPAPQQPLQPSKVLDIAHRGVHLSAVYQHHNGDLVFKLTDQAAAHYITLSRSDVLDFHDQLARALAASPAPFHLRVKLDPEQVAQIERDLLATFRRASDQHDQRERELAERDENQRRYAETLDTRARELDIRKRELEQLAEQVRHDVEALREIRKHTPKAERKPQPGEVWRNVPTGVLFLVASNGLGYSLDSSKGLAGTGTVSPVGRHPDQWEHVAASVKDAAAAGLFK